MHIGSSNRYAYVSQSMFVLILLGVAVAGSGSARWIAKFGVLWLLVVGIAEFHDDPVRKYFTRGPLWLDEVAAWHRDPNHLIRIWPDGWAINMNAHEPFDH